MSSFTAGGLVQILHCSAVSLSQILCDTEPILVVRQFPWGIYSDIVIQICTSAINNNTSLILNLVLKSWTDMHTIASNRKCVVT